MSSSNVHVKQPEHPAFPPFESSRQPAPVEVLDQAFSTVEQHSLESPAHVKQPEHPAFPPFESSRQPAPVEVLDQAFSTVEQHSRQPAPVQEVEPQFLLTNEDFQLSDEDIQNYLTDFKPEEENVDVDDECEIIYVKPGDEFDYSKVKVKIEPVD